MPSLPRVCASVASLVRRGARVGGCARLQTAAAGGLSAGWWVRRGNQAAQDALEDRAQLVGGGFPPSAERRPADSLCGALLPLRGDAALQRAFTTAQGSVRVGRLLEELDAFAGGVAARHCGGLGSAGGVLVTAALDRLDLLTYPLPLADLLLVGAVSNAGASSLTIEVDVAAVGGAGEQQHLPLLAASLTFVARDASNAAVRVPRLAVGASPWEAALAAAGAAASAARRAARATALSRLPPTAAELATVHAMFLAQQQQPPPQQQQRAPDADAAAARPLVSARALAVQTTLLTQPQDRNLYGRVFGGFIMRNAFEAAYAAGWCLTGVPPKFLSLDGVAFLLPVEVGRLLTFEAFVDYARDDGRTYSVAVTAKMREPGVAGGEAVTTNTFYFTFYSDKPAPRLRLESYDDAMRFIEGGRRANVGRALAESRAASGVALRFPDDVVASVRAGAKSATAADVLGAAAPNKA